MLMCWITFEEVSIKHGDQAVEFCQFTVNTFVSQYNNTCAYEKS